MTSRCSVVKVAVAITATVLLAACGVADTGVLDTKDEAARGGEPGATMTVSDMKSRATDAEAVPNASQPTVTLPYTTFFEIQEHRDSRRFVLKQHSSISVLVRAAWDKPGLCHSRAPTFTIAMHAEDIPYQVDTRRFPADGNQHAASWQT